MPVTHAQGHHERSPVCSAGTTSVTTRARAQTAVPRTTIVRVGTSRGSVGAELPSASVGRGGAPAPRRHPRRRRHRLAVPPGWTGTPGSSPGVAGLSAVGSSVVTGPA